MFRRRSNIAEQKDNKRNNKYYNTQPKAQYETKHIYLPFIPLGDTCVNLRPHSLRKPIATSTLSSVGLSRSKVSISKHKTSCALNRIKTYGIEKTFYIY